MKYLKAMGIAAFAISLLFLTACGGGDDKKKDVKLILTPGMVPVVIGQPAIFTVGTTNTDFSVSTDKAAAGCVKTNATTVTCTPTAAGTYELTVTATEDSKVTAKATITVSELSVSVELSSTSETVVIGQSTSFTVTTENTDFEISTSPATGAGCVKVNSTLVTCTPTEPGKYTLTVTATENPIKTVAAIITGKVSVTTPSGPVIGIPGQSVTFMVTTKGTDYEISFPDGIECEQNGDKVTCVAPPEVKSYDVTIKATKDPEQINTVTINCMGPVMVLMEHGTFRMGCDPENGSCTSGTSTPAHDVTLTKDFYIGKYEVTQAEWKALMGEDNNPSAITEFPDPDNDNIPATNDNLPVTMVSKTQVQAFIDVLNAQTGKNYRLPTEAEWEYAARNAAADALNNNQKYSGTGASNPKDVAWFYGSSAVNGVKTPHPVGTTKNCQEALLRICDMSGNVSEWVQDVYASYNYASSDPVIDPVETRPASLNRSVERGGYWNSLPASLIVWEHGQGFDMDSGSDTIGFRLVLELPAETDAALSAKSAIPSTTGVWDSAISGVKSLNSITK
jgi:formylglycine-generating enzyme required for sulfatase activity